ncbi:MAG: hypothetical protein JWN46_1319 [Acidimicrobiales bacterium]|nr:hypothetical protein [Acidimicrobiales bacterium]
MLLWFAGGSLVLVFHVFRSPALDYRWIVLGAVLPVSEALLGGPRLLHTLLGSVVVLGVVMLATRRHRLLRRQLLGLPIGLFVHLVLDGIWMRSRVFWWPFLGWSFGSDQVPELTRGWFALVLELAGAAALWWTWRAFGLADPGRRGAFLRTGQLVPVDAPRRR